LIVLLCLVGYDLASEGHRKRLALLGELGDIASILGLAVTFIGFGATLYQATQSRRAAEQARDRVLDLNALVGVDSAIRVLEDIRRLHRLEAWPALPDRYTSLMMDLRAIRTRTPSLSKEHQREIQGVVTQLANMERQVERIVNGKAIAEVTGLNITVTRQINRLADLLVELQTKMQG